MHPVERLRNLQSEALGALKGAETLEAIEEIRVAYLGREGRVTSILRGIGDLPVEQRAEVGRVGNRVKAELQQVIEQTRGEVQRKEYKRKISRERLDVTAPGRCIFPGRLHPLYETMREVIQIFVSMGYHVASGPEVETDWFNFTGLNIPKDHPARDMQDSFYVGTGDDLVLRSQTSPIQLRYMRSKAPELPVRVVGPGRVYRRGDDDMSHSPVFHQCEALLVDENITFGHLRGTLMHFTRRLFGSDVTVRFRPSYFPFTEPSAEVDISCTNCGGEGCPTCSYTGYLELLGAGMVHPRVLRNGGYDPERVSGFAFGLGIERVAMLKHNIRDMRSLYRNDLRFLKNV